MIVGGRVVVLFSPDFLLLKSGKVFMSLLTFQEMGPYYTPNKGNRKKILSTLSIVPGCG